MSATFAQFFHALPDAVYVIDPATSRIVDGNEKAHASLGLSREQLLAQSVMSLQTGVQGMPAWSEIAEVIRSQAPYRFIGEHRHADGSAVPVEILTSVQYIDGQEYFVSVAREIRERGCSADEDAGRERWQVLHDIAEGVWDWYPQEGRLVFSPNLKSLLGYGPDEMREVLDTWKDNVHPDDRPLVLTKLEDHLAGRRHMFQAEYRLRNRNGHYVWVSDRGRIVLRDEGGEPLRVCGMIHDVTDAKAQELFLQQKADHCPLTGLLNRRRGQERFDEALRGCKREGRPLTALVADLDHFKTINDRFGHQAGDLVLERFGDCIRDVLPRNAITMRWGGEEFVVVLPDCDRMGGETRAERLRAAVARAHWPAPLEGYRITTSIGVASFPEDADSSAQLTSIADQALYRAKRAGRNRVTLALPA